MSFSETVFLFFLALIIFGPKKLPEIARMVGKYLNEFRRASNEFKAQIEQEISHLEVEQKKLTVMTPSPRVEGTTSRTLHSASVQDVPSEKPTNEAPATLAVAEPSNSLDHTSQDSGSQQPPVATESAVPADAPADAVTSSTSQESHA